MLLNGNLANDSGQEAIFVERELLKVNLFVLFFVLFCFFFLRKKKSEFYLSQNTNVYSSKKNDDPLCETD